MNKNESKEIDKRERERERRQTSSVLKTQFEKTDEKGGPGKGVCTKPVWSTSACAHVKLGRDQRSMEANDPPCGIVPEM